MSRRLLILPILLFLTASPARAQESGSLQAAIQDLFRFSDCGDPLCLTLSDEARERDFVSAAARASRTLTSFIGTTVGTSVAAVPISNASSGVIFTFEGGVPTREDISTGPIYAERAQTVGGGRILAGGNVTFMSFNALRGVSLNDLSFNLTTRNIGSASFGDPGFENSVVEMDLDLDLSLVVGQLFAIYGITERIDLGIAVPIVSTSLSGTSQATLVGGGGSSPYHFGAPGSPSTTATASIDESAFGIGDIATRLKVNLSRQQTAALAVLAEARFPTGSQEDLIGSGSFSFRGLGIASARFGSFSPHINAGYMLTGADWLNDAALATVGFDQLLTPWATFAFDLVTQWKTGGGTIELPQPIQFTAPTERLVSPTNIPDAADDAIDASFGFRFNHESGVRGVLNAVVPVNDGGLRPGIAWTVGVEYNGAFLGGS